MMDAPAVKLDVVRTATLLRVLQQAPLFFDWRATIAERDATVIALYRGGATIREIAPLADMSTRAVHAVIQRHERATGETLPRNKPGRKPKRFAA